MPSRTRAESRGPREGLCTWTKQQITGANGCPTRVSAFCHQVPLFWGAEVRQEHAGAGRPWGLRNWGIHALFKAGQPLLSPSHLGSREKGGP